MEYVYGYVTRNGVKYENLKTVGNVHTNLSGSVSITREFNNSFITDNFNIVEKYRSEEDNENYYDWYVIDHHFRYEDKFTPGIIETEQEITNHDLALIETEQEITDLDLRLIELEKNKEES